jgi:aspartate oxidase
MAIGRGLCSRPHLELVARQTRPALAFLASLGVELEEHQDHYEFPAPRPDMIRGAHLVRELGARVRADSGITKLTNFQATDIWLEHGRARGVKGMDRQGRAVSLEAGAVILAAGGAGAVFQVHDNQKSMLGAAYRLAARAGLDLWDMEFVQFFPLVLNEPGLPSLILYPPYPAETRIIYPDGRDVLASQGVGDLSQAIKQKRDSLSSFLFQEGLAGPLRVDFRAAPQEEWERFPMAILGRLKFDFRSRPARISPGAHFCMGGVEIDQQARTGVEGLFACGEAVWGLHGANRRGGNALTECVVTGRLAGLHAAERALSQTSQGAPAPSEFQPWGQGDFPRRELLRRLREIAWERAGVIRDQEGMQAGLAELAELRRRVEAAGVQTPAQAGARENLLSGVMTLEAALTAGLARRESRGAFCRRDYPDQDDARWLQNSRISHDPAGGGFLASRRPARADKGDMVN